MIFSDHIVLVFKLYQTILNYNITYVLIHTHMMLGNEWDLGFRIIKF